jgi:hypothetical protein
MNTAQKLATLLSGDTPWSARMLSMGPIAAFQINDSGGTTMTDTSGNGRDGTYSGVTLGQNGIGDGQTVGLWDGTNDSGVMTTAGLASAFSFDEGAISLWGWPFNVGVWTDSTQRYFIRFYRDADNEINIVRRTSNNDIEFRREAGGATKTEIIGGLSFTTPTNIIMCWSRAGGGVCGAQETKYYINGAQVGSTETAISAQSGSGLTAWIGDGNGLGFGCFYGYIGHVYLFDRPLTATEIATASTSP